MHHIIHNNNSLVCNWLNCQSCQISSTCLWHTSKCAANTTSPPSYTSSSSSTNYNCTSTSSNYTTTPFHSQKIPSYPTTLISNSPPTLVAYHPIPTSPSSYSLLKTSHPPHPSHPSHNLTISYSMKTPTSHPTNTPAGPSNEISLSSLRSWRNRTMIASGTYH